MASEASRKKAEELCRKAGCDCGGTGNIGREVTGYGHVCGGDDRLCQTSCPVPVQDVDYSECERFHDFATALDEARAEGRAEALGDAIPLKDLMAEALAAARAEGRAEGERIGEERATATIRENVMTAKHAAERERWECHRIASDFSDRIGGSAGAVAIRIAGRGPMRGPEEE